MAEEVQRLRSHVGMARELMGADAWLVPEQKVILGDDTAEPRDLGEEAAALRAVVDDRLGVLFGLVADELAHRLRRSPLGLADPIDPTTARSFLDEVPGPAGDATRSIVASTLIDFLRDRKSVV